MFRNTQQVVHLIAATVGFTALAALWLSVLWGIVLRNGWATNRVRHTSVYAIHQLITLLGLWLGIVHALVQLAVPGGHIRLVDEAVPFLEHGKHRIGVGIGVISLEMMIALVLSVLVQRRLGHRRWRKLHSLGHLAFLLLVGHVLFSGSTDQPFWFKPTLVGATMLVLALRLATLPALSRLPGVLVDRLALRLRGRPVTINVDPLRCDRFGFCAREAPKLFRLHSDGRLVYRSSVPTDQVEAAVQAIRICPKRAIMLDRLPTTVIVSPAPVPALPSHQAGQPTGGG